LVLVQVDGKSWERGVSLHDLADLMVAQGVINGINLDGGGSMTSVMNGSLVNMPSDSCPDHPTYFCERKVSTIVCFHNRFSCLEDGECVRGNCYNGKCVCPRGWSGDHCQTETFIPTFQIQQCLLNKSCGHGVCSGDACLCNGSAAFGKYCEMSAHDDIEKMFDGLHVFWVLLALAVTGIFISLLSCIISWVNRQNYGIVEKGEDNNDIEPEKTDEQSNEKMCRFHSNQIQNLRPKNQICSSDNFATNFKSCLVPSLHEGPS